MNIFRQRYRAPMISATAFFLLLLIAAAVPQMRTHAHSGQQPTPTPIPTPRPAATASPSPGPKPVSTQTLEDLQAKIRLRTFAADLRRGRVGIRIVSLATGKVIFENDSEKYFVPASNMKNFTVAAALERLGPDFRFVTSVYAAGQPDTSGNINGDLRIYGRGDVSISTAFNNGDYYRGLDNLVDKIVAAGVKHVQGNLLGDESYFKGFAIPTTWEWDDLQWYDGAEVSALPINNNALDLTVSPGPVSGSCTVSLLPANTIMQIVNRCTTTSPGTTSLLKVFKALNRNQLEISGSMPAGGKPFAGYLTVTHPADLFLAMLKQRLELKGITVTGNAQAMAPGIKTQPGQIEIARLESPTFSVIAGNTMKPSQNMFTETILWTLGEVAAPIEDYVDVPGVVQPALRRPDSQELGLRKVRDFLTSIGIAQDAVIQYDGSGLSRHDLITPAAVTALYVYMAKQSKNAAVWRNSLAVGGVDGTLRRRFVGTAAEGNIRGKTGTLDQVSALSGYVTTSAGDQVVVSIMVNGVADTRTRTSLIDDIVVQLASFNGKLDQ